MERGSPEARLRTTAASDRQPGGSRTQDRSPRTRRTGRRTGAQASKPEAIKQPSLSLTPEARAEIIASWAGLLRARHGGTWEWVERDPAGKGRPAATNDDAHEPGSTGQTFGIVGEQQRLW